jgi:hypothetical protein
MIMTDAVGFCGVAAADAAAALDLRPFLLRFSTPLASPSVSIASSLSLLSLLSPSLSSLLELSCSSDDSSSNASSLILRCSIKAESPL